MKKAKNDTEKSAAPAESATAPTITIGETAVPVIVDPQLPHGVEMIMVVKHESATASTPAAEATPVTVPTPLLEASDVAAAAAAGTLTITRIDVGADDPDRPVASAEIEGEPLPLPEPPFGSAQLPPTARLPPIAAANVLIARCAACHLPRDPEDAGTACPRCGSGFVDIP